MAEVPVVLVRWEAFVLWLFQRTASFPRRLRASLTARLEQRALDVHEGLARARFLRNKGGALRDVSDALDAVRLLLRLAHELRCLSSEQAEHAFGQVDEVGRMVGGWQRAST